MDRRTFIAGITTLATATSLAQLARATTPASSSLAYFQAVDEISQKLKDGTLTASQWQDRLAELARGLDPDALRAAIDFRSTARGLTLPDLGVATTSVRIDGLRPAPDRLRVIRKLFGVRRGRAIIPHGHANMVSSHFVLSGELHLRQYDRIELADQHMVVRPTVDRLAVPGDLSSVSDERDNVHWFVARSDTAWALDLLVVDLDETANAPYQIYNLDPDHATEAGNGLLRMPILPVDQALERYGKT